MPVDCQMLCCMHPVDGPFDALAGFLVEIRYIYAATAANDRVPPRRALSCGGAAKVGCPPSGAGIAPTKGCAIPDVGKAEDRVDMHGKLEVDHVQRTSPLPPPDQSPLEQRPHRRPVAPAPAETRRPTRNVRRDARLRAFQHGVRQQISGLRSGRTARRRRPRRWARERAGIHHAKQDREPSPVRNHRSDSAVVRTVDRQPDSAMPASCQSPKVVDSIAI